MNRRQILRWLASFDDKLIVEVPCPRCGALIVCKEARDYIYWFLYTFIERADRDLVKEFFEIMRTKTLAEELKKIDDYFFGVHDYLVNEHVIEPFEIECPFLDYYHSYKMLDAIKYEVRMGLLSDKIIERLDLTMEISEHIERYLKGKEKNDVIVVRKVEGGDGV